MNDGKEFAVDLIPYEAHHVPLVYSWLANDLDLRMTVGTDHEPSLQDEFINQRNIQNHPLSRWKRLISVSDGSNNFIVGDIDFFFVWNDPKNSCLTAEVNLMIANTKWRSKGIGSRAIIQAMNHLKVQFDGKCIEFVAKIQAENTGSLRFFKSLEFTPINETPNVFNELILSRK